jgi:hypothetical protein
MSKKKKRKASASPERPETPDSPDYVPSPDEEPDDPTPQEESIDRFTNYLGAFLAANAVRVRNAYDSHRGWEAWLHVELFLYIMGQDPAADIEREPHAYPGAGAQLRADYLFEGITVEIKAEREAQSAATFATGVATDAGKLEQLDEGEYAIVIGVCISPGAHVALAGAVEVVMTAQGGGQMVYYGYTSSS